MLGCSGSIPLLLALAVAPLAAQSGTGDIEGTITDNSGSTLPGVTVTAKSPALQVPEVTVVSEGDGTYRLRNLPAGRLRAPIRSDRLPLRGPGRTCASRPGSSPASTSRCRSAASKRPSPSSASEPRRRRQDHGVADDVHAGAAEHRAGDAHDVAGARHDARREAGLARHRRQHYGQPDQLLQLRSGRRRRHHDGRLRHQPRRRGHQRLLPGLRRIRGGAGQGARRRRRRAERGHHLSRHREIRGQSVSRTLSVRGPVGADDGQQPRRGAASRKASGTATS